MKFRESDFKFLNPRIKYTELIVNDDFDISFYNGIDISYKKEEIRLESNSAQVELIMIIGSKDKSSPFFIKVKIASIFKWAYNQPENDIAMLLNQNAVAMLISYLRPYIANLTSSAGFNAYHIPFINLHEAD